MATQTPTSPTLPQLQARQSIPETVLSGMDVDSKGADNKSPKESNYATKTGINGMCKSHSFSSLRTATPDSTFGDVLQRTPRESTRDPAADTTTSTSTASNWTLSSNGGDGYPLHPMHPFKNFGEVVEFVKKAAMERDHESSGDKQDDEDV